MRFYNLFLLCAGLASSVLAERCAKKSDCELHYDAFSSYTCKFEDGREDIIVSGDEVRHKWLVGATAIINHSNSTALIKKENFKWRDWDNKICSPDNRKFLYWYPIKKGEAKDFSGHVVFTRVANLFRDGQPDLHTFSLCGVVHRPKATSSVSHPCIGDSTVPTPPGVDETLEIQWD
ncbi:hypothetical protein RhiJN_05198 [Ceratobasidium sp. AG-Ba]|nr:hypothetical protein RhiJN_05198 [Ceratobasidium sp. AG-Ba]QRW06115.1 hypothetical protein RhiLY_05114 [Ceratobasidium sp. AG-Ba]